MRPAAARQGGSQGLSQPQRLRDSLARFSPRVTLANKKRVNKLRLPEGLSLQNRQSAASGNGCLQGYPPDPEPVGETRLKRDVWGVITKCRTGGLAPRCPRVSICRGSICRGCKLASLLVLPFAHEDLAIIAGAYIIVHDATRRPGLSRFSLYGGIVASDFALYGIGAGARHVPWLNRYAIDDRVHRR